MAGDDIVDAEWEEIPESNLAAQPPRLTTSRPQQAHDPLRATAAQSDSSPWRSYAFWHDVLGRILVVIGRIGLAALGLIVLLLVIVWLGGGDTHAPAADQPALDAQTHAEQPTTDKQMLSDWSQAVTGKPSTSGFALIDGEGKPGEFCSSSSGSSLMNFGGRSLPPEHADMYTYFSWLPDKSDTGTVGFFTFDPAAGELLGHDLIQGNVATDRHHDIADKRFKVNPDGSGRVTIDGTRYHVCVL